MIIDGASIRPPSQSCSAVSSRLGPPTVLRPSGASSWDQSDVGCPQQFPSFLYRSQVVPSVSVAVAAKAMVAGAVKT